MVENGFCSLNLYLKSSSVIQEYDLIVALLLPLWLLGTMAFYCLSRQIFLKIPYSHWMTHCAISVYLFSQLLIFLSVGMVLLDSSRYVSSQIHMKEFYNSEILVSPKKSNGGGGWVGIVEVCFSLLLKPKGLNNLFAIIPSMLLKRPVPYLIVIPCSKVQSSLINVAIGVSEEPGVC